MSFIQDLLIALLASVITLGSTVLFCIAVLKYTNNQNAKKRSASLVELGGDLLNVDEPVPFRPVVKAD